MQCAHCASPVPDNARFCHSCGSAVSGPDGATATMNSSELQQMEGLLRADTAAEFTIERLLGRGGMAAVYLAKETHLDRQVAIKVLPPELTFGQGVERFKREAKTAAALDHPHIIPIYRVASGNKIFWYAMKYLEGQSLEELLKERRRLPLDETIAILDQVAKALDHAHKRHVIHRDVKPANVMLDAERRVVVTDFGIAKALTAVGLTASGSVVGTPYYMSPEQGMGGQLSGASDQYSVGVMAYRMLSGRVLFDGDSPIEILHKHCMEPPPSLETVGVALPPHVYQAVHRALAKKPEQRFSSVGAFVEALRHPAPDATLPSLGAARTPTPAPAARTGRRTKLAVAIAAAAGVAVVAAVWARAGRRGAAAPSADTTRAAPASPAPASPALAVTRPPTPARPKPPPPPHPVAPSAPPPAPPVQPVASGLHGRGVVTMVVNPDADLFIDEVYIGSAHVRSDTLRPGPHLVRLEREGFRAVDTTVTVVADQVVHVEFRLTKR